MTPFLKFLLIYVSVWGIFYTGLVMGVIKSPRRGCRVAPHPNTPRPPTPGPHSFDKTAREEQ